MIMLSFLIGIMVSVLDLEWSIVRSYAGRVKTDYAIAFSYSLSAQFNAVRSKNSCLESR